MAFVLNAEHVEGFPFLPIGTAPDAIETRNREGAIPGQEYLDPHLLRANLRRQGSLGVAQGLNGISQGGKLDQVVKTDQATARSLVIAPLALQIVEARSLEGCGQQGQKGRFNAQGLDAEMVYPQDLMVETLGYQPAAYRAGRWGCQWGSFWPRGGCGLAGRGRWGV